MRLSELEARLATAAGAQQALAFVPACLRGQPIEFGLDSLKCLSTEHAERIEPAHHSSHRLQRLYRGLPLHVPFVDVNARIEQQLDQFL